MKVEIKTPESRLISVSEMKAGQVGIRERDGEVYYRTYDTAAALKMAGNTYSHAREQTDKDIRLLPPGTTLTLTVEV